MERHHDQHDRVHGLLAAYALDGLGDEERRGVEFHLSECPECRRRAITHLESVSFDLDEPLQLPARLWDAMVERVRNRAPHPVSPAAPIPVRGPAGTG